MNRVEQSLAGKGLALEHVDTPCIQCLSAGVRDPEGAQGLFGIFVPQRYLLRVDASLEDGHQRRLVLADRDVLLDVVLE